MWRRAALCAVWAAPCGAVRRRADAVPCGHRRVAPCGTMLCRAAPCAPCVPCGNAARRVARARRVACRVACRAVLFFPLVTPPFGWRVRVTAVDLVFPSAQVQSPRAPSSLPFMMVPSVGLWPIPLEERPPPSGPSRIEIAAVFGALARVPWECPLLQAPFGCPGLGPPRLLGSGAT